MHFKRTVLPAVLAGGLTVGQTGLAEETADIVKELRQQIEQLDQKVKVLERKGELEQEAAVEKGEKAVLSRVQISF
jgi:chaperonin cofactor prefoldin